MKDQKRKLGLILFGLGMLGVLSVLTMNLPLPPDQLAELNERFSPLQIKLITVANPTFLLIVFTIIGTLLYDKLNFKLPIIESWAGIENVDYSIPDIIKFGIGGGVLAGVLLCLVTLFFLPYFPTEFIELGERLQPTLAARFLYGGITEEILMRFGLMTLIVWICSKIFKGKKPIVYWIGILLVSILFGLGHFPVAYMAVENPSAALLTYVVVGNALGGIIFGWLYWKHGLESAFLAHIFTHVVLVLAQPLLM